MDDGVHPLRHPAGELPVARPRAGRRAARKAPHWPEAGAQPPCFVPHRGRGHTHLHQGVHTHGHAGGALGRGAGRRVVAGAVCGRRGRGQALRLGCRRQALRERQPSGRLPLRQLRDVQLALGGPENGQHCASGGARLWPRLKAACGPPAKTHAQLHGPARPGRRRASPPLAGGLRRGLCRVAVLPAGHRLVNTPAAGARAGTCTRASHHDAQLLGTRRAVSHSPLHRLACGHCPAREAARPGHGAPARAPGLTHAWPRCTPTHAHAHASARLSWLCTRTTDDVTRHPCHPPGRGWLHRLPRRPAPAH